MTNEAIQPHNTKAAATWGSPGELYDEISRGLTDSIEHCLYRLDIRPGERVLDVACGTGLATRAIAARVPEANVYGVDIAEGLLQAARTAASRGRLNIEYRLGDAEKLPFENESFDVVLSTFGVMFSSRPENVASELARVTRRGGRLALTTWKPDSTVFEMFKVMKPYLPEPPSPAPPSPFAWGSRERIRELFGASFAVKFEEGVSPFRAPGPEQAWQIWITNYGPTRVLAGNLPDERRESFHRDMLAFHERFTTDLGVSKPRDYLLTIGTKI